MAEQNHECFEVYITRKGPVLVSGPNRVAILHSVIGRSESNTKAVELCSVTADTKLPKSSIFSTLEDLVKKNVLRYGSVCGKKGYELDSYRIISSAEPHPEYSNFGKELVKNSPEGYTMDRMELDYMATAALTYGMDISPLMKTIGYDFGKYIKRLFPDTDEALERLFEWYRRHGSAEVRITSRLPLSVEVDYALRSVGGDLAKTFSCLVLQSVAAIVEDGYNAIIERIEVKDNHVTGTFRSDASVNDRDLVPSDFGYDEDASNDFMIYITPLGAFRCVDNPLGLAILDAMKNDVPMSSAEITKSLKVGERKPQSSVLFYLEKMIDIGLVKETEILGKRKFVKVAGNLYSWNLDRITEPYDPFEHFHESFDDPSSANGHILSAMARRLGSLRIAINPIIGRLGESLAREFCSLSERKTIESILSVVMDRANWFRFSETSVTSFVPFTFVRKLDPDVDDIFMDTQMVFDTTFFKTIIKEITGVEYGSECTMYNSGESRGYKLVYQLRSR